MALQEQNSQVNGMEYSYSEISTIVNGVLLAGVSAIEYGTKQKHTNVYAKYVKPIAMATGQESFGCKLTMIQSQFEALQRSMPRGVGVNRAKPFDITISYGNSADSLIVDKLVKCRIEEWNKKHSTDAENMSIEVTILPFDIQPNITGPAVPTI